MSPSLALKSALAAGLLTATLAGSSALAQAMNTNASSFNAGYGRVQGQENRGVQVGNRDANGNRLIVDGIIQLGTSSFANSEASAIAMAGASASASGVGASGGASAVGNNLTVVTTGNYNTVIVNSSQVNNGAVTATTVVNGN